MLVELSGGNKRYESYRNGFRALVDKDGLYSELPQT